MTLTALCIDDFVIPVEASGPARKARLTMERDGSLKIRAAEDVSPEELSEFVSSKRHWIYRKLAEKELFDYESVSKELVDGEGFPYLGRNQRLLIASDGRPTVRMVGGRLVLPMALRDQGHDALIAWYSTRGRAWLPRRVDAWASRLRADVTNFDVRDLGHKWGIADSRGRMRIHWAALQLRPPLIDYILVHELAHLHEPHHGPAFWRLVGRVMPDYEDRRAELAQVGSRTWIGQARR